ncbi:GntR family transcriptional regulator [Promicromonospora umidemergens]|uniref:HTH gntR-type domain-containing protein n=1 Tax=Promicromonospora umidemergens TaxID=629679 RepID=A0ABP8YC99_9MICO|nr:GntR family transcriptional regulator [Promicromonospora umidemergens]MCP2287086.1 GntR family transcriptional regulator [Promicromonospora umidemergens]
MARAGTLFRGIADEIRNRITTGELAPGTRLPTESQLMDQYGTSRNTIRLALAALENEGLIATEQGRGSFVREWSSLTHHATRAERVDRPSSSTDAFVAEAREAGFEPSTAFSMRIEPAVAEVADRLQIPIDTFVVLRRVVRYIDGQVSSRQDSWYPMDVAEKAGLNVPHDIKEGTVRAMAAAGYVEVGHIDEVTSRMPSPDDHQTLDVATGVPVIVYVRTAWTEERPTRVTRVTLPADRNRIVYELGNIDAYEATQK